MWIVKQIRPEIQNSVDLNHRYLQSAGSPQIERQWWSAIIVDPHINDFNYE
jgi:hypothetical protein